MRRLFKEIILLPLRVCIGDRNAAYKGSIAKHDSAKKCSEDTFKDAPHLHVSVIKYDKVFVFDECLTDSEKIGTKESTYNWLSSFKKLYVDPFDYTIEWKGMQSIPGKE